MAGMTQCFYSCGTDGCTGRGVAIWCGLGLLVLWDGPLIDGCYSVPRPSHEWINAAIKALRAADINGCVHEDKPPPATLPLPPAPGGALHFAGEDWHLIAEGVSFDLADQFAVRVSDLRGRGHDLGPVRVTA